MKILLRAFNIDIEDVEDTLPVWKAKSMLKQNVTGDLAPFQMFRFYQDFGIKDISVWGDLSFEDTEQLLKTMANKEDMSSTSVTSTDTNIPPLSATNTNTTNFRSFDIQTKKREAFISVYTITCR
jgi:hypothetical protein